MWSKNWFRWWKWNNIPLFRCKSLKLSHKIHYIIIELNFLYIHSGVIEWAFVSSTWNATSMKCYIFACPFSARNLEVTYLIVYYANSFLFFNFINFLAHTSFYDFLTLQEYYFSRLVLVMVRECDGLEIVKQFFSLSLSSKTLPVVSLSDWSSSISARWSNSQVTR